MNTRLITTFGASALVIAAAAAGIASASDRSAAADAKAAAGSAAHASQALGRHDQAAAVAAAEHAVELAPRDAGYRVLLGQSYLAAGRFVSARAAFADAATLAPTNGKAALNLVLTQIATGDWATARRTLDEHGATIAPADRGLALALAGDPNGAVQLLTEVARSPETSAKVRQNLALSFALAGNWAAARTVAAVDLSPASVDARLEQWAGFAHPHAASDQVAALLGVTAAEDHGQPTRLALAGDEPRVALAAAAPVSPAAATPAADTAPVAVAAVASVQPGFVASPVVFGPRVEVVQPLHLAAPVALATANSAYGRPAPAKVAPGAAPKVVAARAPVRTPAPSQLAAIKHGDWFVQLGAFNSSAVARDAWNRAARRMPALATRGPSGASFTVNRTTFYRLSVGGFARGQADATCRHYRSIGGACFVRAGAGDRVASWAAKSVQVASR